MAVLSHIIHTVGLLPNWILPSLVQLFTGQSREMASISASLFCYSVVQSSFYLTQDELKQITDPNPCLRHAETGKKVIAYYAKGDGWAPVEFCDFLEQDYPNVTWIRCTRGLPHAFCLGKSLHTVNLHKGIRARRNHGRNRG